MTFEIIATGSGGNCLALNGGQIAIDMGIPYTKVEPYVKDLRLVLLTHIHSDHFNPSTVGRLARERPTLRWGCCEWMVEPLVKAGVPARRIDVLDAGHWYNYPWATESADEARGSFTAVSLSPFRLTHDVPNCGWKLRTVRRMPEDLGHPHVERILYATDTGTMEDVIAKGYDMYFLEANHTRAELEERLRAKEAAGEYAYERRAAATHLSQEQALDWLYSQMGPNSEYIFMHQHQERGGKCEKNRAGLSGLDAPGEL